MSQDTRKDKRAKVVSLNVRYKSATVDEFIENHSHDVSKGGIFVKTPTPFPPGTLLKFEIRLAGDKSVISGVGRVVWKREPTQASPEKPAGMGVKFIKIDDASRAVIDRLIAQKADAGSAYTSDPAALEEEKAPAGQPTTLRGIPAAPAAAPVAAPAPAPAAAPPAAKPAAAAPAATPAAKPFPAPASSTPGAKVAGATAAKPLPGGAAGSPMAKTMPLGTSPLQSGQTMPGAPKPTPGSPGTPAAPRAGGPPPPMANKPATAIGIGPSPTTAKPAVAAPPPAAAAPPPAAAPVAPASQPRIGAAPAPRPPAVNARKATMMGVGLPAPSSAPGADKAGTGSPLDKLFETSPVSGAGTGGSHDPHDIPTPLAEITPMGVPVEPKTGSGANPMFPKQASEKDFDSVKEPTVMKQAAELLEEALREAGGSIDEIGQNPLFSKSSQRGGAVEEKRPSTPDLHQSGDTLMMSSPLKGGAPTPAPPQASVTPSPSASVTPSPAQSQPPPSVQQYDRPAAAKPLSESIREPEKKKGGAGGLIAGLLVVAVLVGGGVYAYKSGMLASVLGETPVPSAAPTPTPTPSAAPTPTPSTSDSAALAATDASTTSSGDAAASTDGSAASATATDGGANAAGADAAAAMAKDAGAAGALTAVVKPPPPPPPPQPKPKPKPPPPPPPDTDSTTQPSPPSTPTKDPAPAPTPTPTPTATDNP